MKDAADNTLARWSGMARQAAPRGDWPQVAHCARQILAADGRNPEGWFLTGLARRAAGQLPRAAEAFQLAIEHGPERYDAGIELASVCRDLLRHGEAVRWLDRFEEDLSGSPMYLFKAAETWSRLGLHDRALPLFRQANALQPGVERLQSGLAACSVLNGHVDEARRLYRELLDRHPGHQRHHYELSRLGRATDTAHIDEMRRLLGTSRAPPEKNIFMYYALAKELEDLERWEEAFEHYRRAGDAAAAVARAAGYSVASDVAVMDGIARICTAEWLAPAREAPREPGQRPVFVVGLPRTGTTLVERIIGSHSSVESADETFFMELAVKEAGGAGVGDAITPSVIETAAQVDPAAIARRYMEFIGYRLAGLPSFIDKYPFNFLYLGYIARAFPQASLVHLRRRPMDACFAMFKQSFFRFSYTLDDLAEYYLAYDRLSRHWRAVLGSRLIEVEYEALVADPELQIRSLLGHLGLDFEPNCLAFHRNTAPSATASTVQVREKMHTRSVGRWRHFGDQLAPLRARLESAGVRVD